MWQEYLKSENNNYAYKSCSAARAIHAKTIHAYGFINFTILFKLDF